MTISNMYFFTSEVVKIAGKKSRKKKEEMAKDVGVIGLSAYGTKRLGDAGLERMGGVQRFVHGTSSKAGKSIRKQGLLASHGGRAGGGAALVETPAFVEASRGNIHVARDNLAGRVFIANPHASLAEAGSKAKGKKLTESQQAKAFLRGLLPGSKGEVVGGAMSHKEFKDRFVQDPDHIPYLGQKSKTSVKASRLKKGRAGTLAILRNINPRDLPRYISKNPGRFGRGVVYAGGAYGLGSYGLNRLRKRKRKAKKG